jgi:hypothetical protein
MVPEFLPRKALIGGIKKAKLLFGAKNRVFTKKVGGFMSKRLLNLEE